jgi:myo-inositol-1(or 4)-monophosphatase
VGPLDPHALLDLACDVARRAGEFLVSARPQTLDVETKSTPTDVVTDMDQAAERLIVEALQAARPGDGVLGEEGAYAAGSSGVRWVIDPIDGTVNYLYGLPGWAVSIAGRLEDEAIVAVVHVPSQGETFTAVRNEGAWRDGEPIRCNPAPPLERALVATGFGYDAHRRASQAEVLRRLLPQIRDIRRLGVCAVDLCAVACGRVDAYYERGVRPWDYAAGALIAHEAGAFVGGIAGAPPSSELLLAAPPGLFEALHDVLAGLHADQDLPFPAH